MVWIRRGTRSIFVKFVLSFIAAGLLPLFALGYALLNAFSVQSGRYNDSSLNQMTLFIAKSADQIITGYNTISKMMYNENWYGRLQENAGIRGDTAPIDELLTSVLSSDGYIENVFYIPFADGEIHYLSRKAKVFMPGRFPLADISHRLANAPERLTIMAVHPEDYFGVTAGDSRVLTFARYLLDTSSILEERPRVIGILVFDVNIQVFDNMISQIELGAGDEIVLADAEERIAYSTRAGWSGQAGETQEASESGKRQTRTVAIRLSSADLEVTGRFSQKDFFSFTRQFQGMVFAAAGGCILILLLLAFFFSRKFSSPIREMMKHMTKLESGSLDARLPVRAEDELGHLFRGMNRMAEKLKQFIEEAYIARIKQEKAELDALKNQIRPHYLFNTLEVIRMSAVSEDAMEAADMIHALSNQLEYVLDYGENMVELWRELQNVEDYLSLIQARYEDQVGLAINVAPEVGRDWGIVKLSLQPLVENAVMHGIVPTGREGRIAIAVTRPEDQTLLVEVRDNGAGIDEVLAAALNRSLHEGWEEREGRHLGLKNVHDRIQSHCGPGYGAEIGGRPGEGAWVRLRLPVIKEVRHGEAHRISGG